MSAPIRLSWAQRSETGSRDSNQDRLGAARHGELVCLVVADGAGGHLGGETAAQAVVDAVLAAFCALPAPAAGQADSAAGASASVLALARACADAAIVGVAAARDGSVALAEMSSTVALLVVDQAAALAAWAHLGDSRIYLLRAGAVHMASRDHSLAQQLIDAGYAANQGVRQHPQRRVLLAAVGAENGVAPALNGAPVALLPGDALLLCSDGIWEWVDEADMLAALPTSGRSEDWLDALCAMAARAAGSDASRDNYSAYAVRVHGEAVP